MDTVIGIVVEKLESPVSHIEITSVNFKLKESNPSDLRAATVFRGCQKHLLPSESTDLYVTLWEGQLKGSWFHGNIPAAGEWVQNAAHIGFRTLMIGVSWMSLEPHENSFDYSVPDAVLSAACAHNMQAVVLLDLFRVPLWARNKFKDGLAKDIKKVTTGACTFSYAHNPSSQAIDKVLKVVSAALSRRQCR